MTPDPNRPNTNQPYTNRPKTLNTQNRTDMPWGWIGGVAAVLILGLIVWSLMDGTSTTATNKAPAMTERAPVTTGSGPVATPPPAAQKRETTGAAR
jgi:hypothetical protein